MSTETATLSDFSQQQSKEERQQERIEEYRLGILETGGIYGRDATNSSEPTATPTRVCLTCGRDIPRGVATVIGDNDGCVEACDRCWIGNGNEPYSGISRAVRRYRAGSGKPKPEFRGED